MQKRNEELAMLRAAAEKRYEEAVAERKISEKGFTDKLEEERKNHRELFAGAMQLVSMKPELGPEYRQSVHYN